MEEEEEVGDKQGNSRRESLDRSLRSLQSEIDMISSREGESGKASQPLPPNSPERKGEAGFGSAAGLCEEKETEKEGATE